MTDLMRGLLRGSRQRRAIDNAIKAIDQLVLRDTNNKRFDGWDPIVEKLSDLRPTSRITGSTEVLCHDIEFWFDLSPIDSIDFENYDLENQLVASAADRAKEMIMKGFREGELCFTFRTDVVTVELRGWWSIRKEK